MSMKDSNLPGLKAYCNKMEGIDKVVRHLEPIEIIAIIHQKNLSKFT